MKHIKILCLTLLIASCKKAPITNQVNNITQVSNIGKVQEYTFNGIKFNHFNSSTGYYDTTLYLPLNTFGTNYDSTLLKDMVVANIRPDDYATPIGNLLQWYSIPYQDTGCNINQYIIFKELSGQAGIYVKSTVSTHAHNYALKVTITQ